MQSKKARRIKIKWGDKICSHPRYDREYYCGTYTGNYVCTQCGKTFSPEEIDKDHSINIKKTDQTLSVK